MQSAMVGMLGKTSGAFAGSVKLIKTHERKQREKKKPSSALWQVSLPITTVIIPGIAILLKKWLPPNDRWLPICEGRYLSLTSEECWESSPWSVVAEHILGQLQSDLLWALSYVYKLFTNGRLRNSGVLFINGSSDTDQICLTLLQTKWEMKGNTGSMTLNMMTKFFPAHLVKSLFSLKTLFCWCFFQRAGW